MSSLLINKALDIKLVSDTINEDSEEQKQEDGHWEEVSCLSDIDERIDENSRPDNDLRNNPQKFQELEKEARDFMRNRKVNMSRPPSVDVSNTRKIDSFEMKNFKHSNSRKNGTDQESQLVKREEVTSVVYKYPSTQPSPNKVIEK